MLGIVAPVAGCFKMLAGHDARHLADHGDRIALAGNLDARHREAVFRIVEGDALDDAGDGVAHCKTYYIAAIGGNEDATPRAAVGLTG